MSRTPWAMGVAVLLWSAALFAPAWTTIYAQPPHTDATTGYWLLAFGWLGPLGASVAWYANVLFAVAVLRWCRGRPIGARLATIAFVIATTALLGSCQIESEADMTPHYARLGGPALWLWLSSFAAILLAARPGRP